MDDSPMMMEWWGESWGAQMNEECPETLPPYGQSCYHCEELVSPGDSGVTQLVIASSGASRAPAHVECFFRMTQGSEGHIRGLCSCYGGDQSDPPGASRRDAARAAYRAFQERFGV